MALPIINNWRNYFYDENEGLGSSYERVILNILLEKTCKEFQVKKVLEAPIFGFTGLSGINSMNLARLNYEVTLVDNRSERLVLIDKIWQEAGLPVTMNYSEDFSKLYFSDNEFDLSWNFSALWFVRDLELFLSELNRVSKKLIILIVPNRTGLGYIWQSLTKDKNLQENFVPRNIRFSSFNPIMKELGWTLLEENFIDTPPWPDIGMKKSELISKLRLSSLFDKDEEEAVQRITLLDYYRGLDEELPQRLLKYDLLERKLPKLMKLFWSHHHYYMYIRKDSGR